MDDFNKTPNIYPNLNAIPSNEEQFRLNKINETVDDKSDDNLPLNKPLKCHNMTITIRSVFKEDGKLYPQVFLDYTSYELNI